METGNPTYYFCMFCTIVDHDTLYWLFSTIAQSYGAMVGIFGLFVVYRFENQSRVRDLIRQRVLAPPPKINDTSIHSNFISVFGQEAYGWSPDDMTDCFQKVKDKEKKGLEALDVPAYNYLQDEMKRISNSRGITQRLQRGSMLFFPFHFAFILLSIVCIFFQMH